MSSIEREGDGIVASTSRGQREECSDLSVSLVMELKRVLENTVARNEYKVRLKNAEKNVRRPYGTDWRYYES